MRRSYITGMLLATSMIFGILIVIAIVNGLSDGNQLVTDLSIAFATAFGPIPVVGIFLRFGFADLIREAVTKSSEEQLEGIRGTIEKQLKTCEEHSLKLIDATETLSELRRCGVVKAFQERAGANGLIKEWLRDPKNNEFIFVGTSFRGLYWPGKGDPEILEIIEQIIKDNGKLFDDPKRKYFLRFIFTHPAFAYLREQAEGGERDPQDRNFSIRQEILESVFMLRLAGIPEDHIAFYKGTPTLFGIMTNQAMFLNPYPYKKQSYTSFGFVVEERHIGAQQRSLYDIYREAHFTGVWEDRENTEIWDDQELEHLWNSSIEKIVDEKRFDPSLPSRLIDYQKRLRKKLRNGQQ